jgi:hypothetical protein
MAVYIMVNAHSGYRANERPLQFILDDETYEIATVLEHWYEYSATYFKVQTPQGKIYLLRHASEDDEWTLQSDFDGDELWARPGMELIAVDGAVIRKAEKLVAACERCRPDNADVPFDWILAEVTDKLSVCEFVLTELARCPNCRRRLTEKTLVEM